MHENEKDGLIYSDELIFECTHSQLTCCAVMQRYDQGRESAKNTQTAFEPLIYGAPVHSVGAAYKGMVSVAHPLPHDSEILCNYEAVFTHMT